MSGPTLNRVTLDLTPEEANMVLHALFERANGLFARSLHDLAVRTARLHRALLDQKQVQSW